MSRDHSIESDGIEADVEQVTRALGKIRDPFVRYFFAMGIEMVAERVGELFDKDGVLPRLPIVLPRLSEETSMPARRPSKSA